MWCNTTTKNYSISVVSLTELVFNTFNTSWAFRVKQGETLLKNNGIEDQENYYRPQLSACGTCFSRTI